MKPRDLFSCAWRRQTTCRRSYIRTSSGAPGPYSSTTRPSRCRHPSTVVQTSSRDPRGSRCRRSGGRTSVTSRGAGVRSRDHTADLNAAQVHQLLDFTGTGRAPGVEPGGVRAHRHGGSAWPGLTATRPWRQHVRTSSRVTAMARTSRSPSTSQSSDVNRWETQTVELMTSRGNRSRGRFCFLGSAPPLIRTGHNHLTSGGARPVTRTPAWERPPCGP